MRKDIRNRLPRFVAAVTVAWGLAWVSAAGQGTDKPIDINSTTPPPNYDGPPPRRPIWTGKPDPNAACPTFWDFAQFRKCALQKMKSYNPPRTRDGKPDMNGKWNMSRTIQDIEEIQKDQYLFYPHMNSMVVEPADGRIPYQPWARKLKDELAATYISPSTACLPRGPVRYVYSSDLHILQQPNYVTMYQERDHLHRIIPITSRPHLANDVKLWYGTRRGRWEGNTLVFETRNINDLSWFDHIGSFVTEDHQITERLTFVDRNTILYEEIVTDPNVFTQPMVIAHALRRSPDKGFDLEILEDNTNENCHHDLEVYEKLGQKRYPGFEAVAPPDNKKRK